MFKKQYEVYLGNSTVNIRKDGKDFFSLSAAVSVNGKSSCLCLHECKDDKIIFNSNDEKMTFYLFEDCIVVEYTKDFGVATPIYDVTAFVDGGMRVNDFDRAFCPQPHGNGVHNMTYYDRLPDISAYGYNSPSMLEFALGNAYGWVSVGLLDLPNTKECKMLDDFSFLIERIGGNKVVTEYVMPRVIITFPKDEFDSIAVFRQKLMDFGEYTPKEKPMSQIPEWWKNTFFCTYGDQYVEERIGQAIDEEWIREYVRIVEEDWGMDKFNLIIDDSWQLPHSFMPVVDKKRFPDLRNMIEDLHAKGHHVILWLTPLFDKITNGYTTRAEELGVLSKDEFKPPMWNKYFERFPGCFGIDYTHDNARQFLREICEQLFGDKEGQYHADGIKMDFLGLIRDPAVSHYAHAERGMGFKELYLFYTMLYEEAKRVRHDVIIDCTVGDPRFEHLIDFNRLHDTHCGTIEKEIRANIIALACPNIPIDSDGCLMFNSWVIPHYVSASIYGFSSNYYVKKYHDAYINIKKAPDERLPDSRMLLTTAEKKAIANLFKMSRNKPDGIPHFESFGNWTLKDGDTINALSQNGKTVIYYPTATNETGYIWTFCDETIILPLCNRKMSSVTPEPIYFKVDYARDRVIMRIRPGVIHTFKNEDAHDGIENIFLANAKRECFESMVNYENN